jgi:hypothetical protein
VRDRLLRVSFAAFVALAIPTAAVLARASVDAPRAGASVDATRIDAPRQDPPGTKAKPVSASNRPHNHGWYVSQAAKNNAADGREHGEAVSKVAHGNQGRALKNKP